MKFVWDNGEWYQGEKPKQVTFDQWLKSGGYIFLTLALIAIGIWWWAWGSMWTLGDLVHKLTLPKHL